MGKPNTQNLIPVTQRTKEEARIISAKGGRGNKNNPKSIMAARIRELKRKGFHHTDAKRLADILSSPEASVVDMHKYLEEIREQCTEPKEKAIVMQHLENLHKLHHGEKKSIDIRSVNVNVNIEKEIEEIDDYLKTILGEDD